MIFFYCLLLYSIFSISFSQEEPIHDFFHLLRIMSLTLRNIDMAVLIRVLKCYVWSTLLYGCEAWTLSSVVMKTLEVFEIWLYRKMLRISWKDRISNDEVYRGMGTGKALLGDIVGRQLSFLGACVTERPT